MSRCTSGVGLFLASRFVAGTADVDIRLEGRFWPAMKPDGVLVGCASAREACCWFRKALAFRRASS